MNPSFLVLALAALAAAAPTACGGSPYSAPLNAADDADFQPSEEPQLAGLPDDPPSPTRLLPGDVVSLRVVSQEPLDAPGLIVAEDGSLPVPLVGEVQVAGLSLEAARASIEDALHQYDRYARVLVTVSEAAGHRATIVGAVERPGAIIVRPDMRLAELIAVSGGPATVAEGGESYEQADLGAARVIRAGAALPVSLSRALEGDPLHNVRVHAGDLVFLPARRGQRISVLGEVHAPLSLAYYRGLRLTEALARAGGATKDADNGDVRVIRGPLSKPKVYTASLRALIDGEGRDVLLEPGDVVYVTEHWYATVTNVMQRLTPALATAAFASTFAR